jgi:hypothetical protein
MTSSGGLNSLICVIRRSSVVLNTAMAPVLEGPAGQTKSRQVGRLFGLPAAIFQIERDPPTASELS